MGQSSLLSSDEIDVRVVNKILCDILQDEDARQDAWLNILEKQVTSREEIEEIAKEVRHRYSNQVIAEAHKLQSLSEPLGNTEAFTPERIIAAEPSKFQDYPPRFQQPANPHTVSLDRDTQKVLKQKFPNLSYRDAIRQLVGLPPALKKNYLWQPWEDELIRKRYSWGGTLAVRLDIPDRTIQAIRGRAKFLGVRFDKLRPQSEWLTTSEVAHILGIGNHRVYRLVKGSKLKQIPVTYEGTWFYFKPEDIIKFIETQIWEYHVEDIAEQYQQYIPFERKQWLPMARVVKELGCHINTVELYKRLKLIPSKITSPYQVLVRLKDVESAKKLRQDKLKQKRWKRVCKYCGSRNYVKFGHRGKYKRSQYFRCKDCGRVFTINGALPKMQYPEHIVQKAMQMRRAGDTLSVIKQQLYDIYKINIPGTGLLCMWFRKFGVVPEVRHSHWRRNSIDLAHKLALSLGQGKIHSAQDVLSACGYSLQTKIEDTQLFRQRMIIRRNGGWVINDSLYESETIKSFG